VNKKPFRMSILVIFMFVALSTAPVIASRVSAEQSSISAAASSVEQEDAAASAPSAPMMFVQNVGQFADEVAYQIPSGGRSISLTEEGIWINVQEPAADNTAIAMLQDAESSGSAVHLKLSFPSANPHPQMEPMKRLNTHVSYFIGNDPQQWRADVPVYTGVRYVDLYPGIDLEVTSRDGAWDWRMVADADANLADVRLKVEGAQELALQDAAFLRVKTELGDFSLPLLELDSAFTTAQERSSTLNEVTQVRISGSEILFPFTDADQHSTIASSQGMPDSLVYSTFLGGSGEDYGYGIAVDSSGNAYVTGYTSSSDFPAVQSSYDISFNGGNTDAFVVKLNAAGTDLIYATFLGGSGYDEGSSIALDGAGNAYVIGYTGSYTGSSDFPTISGSYDISFNGIADAFVVKLNTDGTDLVYATFLGGTDADKGSSIALDVDGNVYVTGYTQSNGFPTSPGYDTTYNGDYDAFAVKLNAGGTDLIYATFLGGSGYDKGFGISVDGAGNAYVTGETTSSDFPTISGSYDTTFNGDYDAFLVKLNAGGTDLIYATFLGGSNEDDGYSIAVDGDGNAYVTGLTDSSDFPTISGSYDTTFNGNYDAFSVKLNASGTNLLYATFLGGSYSDGGSSIALDGEGNAYLTGSTSSSDFPTVSGSYDTSYNGNEDAFLVKLNTDGTDLIYATFLGGSYPDGGSTIALDVDGNAYVTGYTYSSSFPTGPGYDTTYNGGDNDAFVVNFPRHNIHVLDGDTVISDGTGSVDFGITELGVPKQRTFTVINTGMADLTLQEPISLPSGFSLVSSFGETTLVPGQTTSFTVKLDSDESGVYSGTLQFANNDDDKNPFIFTITGKVDNITSEIYLPAVIKE
jgi:hypothetical protein